MNLNVNLINKTPSNTFWKSSEKENQLVFTDLRDQPDSTLAYRTCEGIIPKIRLISGIDTLLNVKMDSQTIQVAVSTDRLAQILNVKIILIINKSNQGNLEEFINDFILERIWPNKETLDEAKSVLGLSEEVLKRVAYNARTALAFLGENTIYQQASEKNPQPFIATKVPGQTYPKITLVANNAFAEGGFGVIKKAVDLEKGRCVVKFANGNQGALESLENEYNILQDIHKNGTLMGIQLPPFQIAHFPKNFDSGGYECALIEPEYPKGKTLKNVPLTSYRAKQMTQGLAHLHQLDISHGDIKPSNIFVRDDRCDLGDFGGARPFSELHEAFIKQDLVELVGTHTDQYFSIKDRNLLIDALTSKNWDRCKRILKARDIYALGLTMRTRYNWTSKIFNKEQIKMTARMIDPNFEKRPTAEEVAKVFA